MPLQFCEIFFNLGHSCTDACDGVLGGPRKVSANMAHFPRQFILWPCIKYFCLKQVPTY